MWLLIPALLMGMSHASFQDGKIEKQGFFDLYLDAKEDKLYMCIERFDEEFLFTHWLVTGLGSNDIGLDRGQPGPTRLVSFKRVGKRVFLTERNLRYRAISDNPDERRAVRESFAYSTLWGGEIAAEENGRVYVDVAKFVFRDERGIIQRLRENREGTYSLDRSRSHYVHDAIKSFPRNTEIQVALTYTGKPEGPYVPTVAPTPEALTMHMRYSFIKLPDEHYKPRRFHPSSGGFDMTWQDYAAPLDADLAQKFVMRHRLVKKKGSNEPVKPLVYYVDRGAPLLIQQALIEGASWWNEAFEAAGFENAYRVELMPEGMDPMDVRYNVIQWVHRATRGWSYGSSVRDPRTGEMIKGHVTLGSLRVRQDRLIFEGVIPADENGNYSDDPDRNPVQLALARIRQLSAHEVGHTLGAAHNFAASSFDRCSVMDYPAPLIKLKDGRIDCSDAYDTGIGEFDKLMIRYLYGEYENEEEGLAGVIQDARDKGILFIDDSHGRSPDTMHPQAHVWDNGADNVAEFERVMTVRNHILSRFGPRNMHPDKFMSRLEEVLTPVYLHHRFQLNACVKSIGGAWFRYAPNDDKPAYEPVEPDRQRKAMNLMLQTLEADFLDLPSSLRNLIPPRASGYPSHREYFERRTGNNFDDLALAETAISLTLDALLSPVRINRIYNQHALDPNQLSVEELVRALLAKTARSPESGGREGVYRRMTTYAAVGGLVHLVGDPTVREDARALIYQELQTLLESLKEGTGEGVYKAHRAWLRHRIQHMDKQEFEPATVMEAPPGSPIGSSLRD